MDVCIRLLKQYTSRVLRLSLRPWVAFVATLSLIFYLAIFSAAIIHVGSDQRDSKLVQGSSLPANLSAGSTVQHVVAVVAESRPKQRQQQQPQQPQQQQKQQQQQPIPLETSRKDKGDDDRNRNRPASAPAAGAGAGAAAAPKEAGVPASGYAAFLQQPIINFHNFSYVHNVADACRKRPIDLVIVSPSGPGNFYRRMMARRSGRMLYTGNPDNRATHLFFLGSSRDLEVQRKVAAESRNFGDIVQESYVDVYANITFKAVQMLKWVSDFCNASENVIRLDDDVTADIGRLLHAMARARSRHRHFVLGEVKRGWPPCRIPKCKTTKEEYPYATLPPFALGGALGYPTSSVQRLYEATKRLKRFKLDDVYVTGMCAPKVGVKLLHDEEFAFQHDAW